MSDLLVRGQDEELVQALKKRAGQNGRSAEGRTPRDPDRGAQRAQEQKLCRTAEQHARCGPGRRLRTAANPNSGTPCI